MVNNDLVHIYINRELQKKIKIYCIKNNIPSMKVFAEKVLEIAIEKPSASDRLEEARKEVEEISGKAMESDHPADSSQIPVVG